jgi:hypothetical protein
MVLVGVKISLQQRSLLRRWLARFVFRSAAAPSKAARPVRVPFHIFANERAMMRLDVTGCRGDR